MLKKIVKSVFRPFWRAAEIRIDKKLNAVNENITILTETLYKTTANIDLVSKKIDVFHGSSEIVARRTSGDSKKNHIVISGVGRSGTTLLVQYFSVLGMDTGFTEEESMRDIDPISHAGLEFTNICAEGSPYIIKSPWLCDTLEKSLDDKCATIDAAIIPIRNLHDAAASRIRASEEAAALGLDPIQQPGGLWKCSTPDDQEKILSEQFYKLTYTLIKNYIKIYFIEFPRFADDHDYLYETLMPILCQHEITKEQSISAYSRVINKSLINKF
ncbi:MAG: hypothetical protein ACYCY0_11700 [Acidithiobacillus ferrivorans]